MPTVRETVRNAPTDELRAGSVESVDSASALAAVIDAFARALKMPAAEFGENTTLEQLGLYEIKCWF